MERVVAKYCKELSVIFLQLAKLKKNNRNSLKRRVAHIFKEEDPYFIKLRVSDWRPSDGVEIAVDKYFNEWSVSSGQLRNRLAL